MLVVNPPAPVPCPIGGRYKFVQEGAPEELFVTRIRGITERPRHLIDCMEFVTEFKSCDNNPKKIYVDAEYCETLDHTAKPIGEYGKWLIAWHNLGTAWYPGSCPFRGPVQYSGKIIQMYLFLETIQK